MMSLTIIRSVVGRSRYSTKFSRFLTRYQRRWQNSTSGTRLVRRNSRQSQAFSSRVQPAPSWSLTSREGRPSIKLTRGTPRSKKTVTRKLSWCWWATSVICQPEKSLTRKHQPTRKRKDLVTSRSPQRQARTWRIPSHRWWLRYTNRWQEAPDQRANQEWVLLRNLTSKMETWKEKSRAAASAEQCSNRKSYL